MKRHYPGIVDFSNFELATFLKTWESRIEKNKKIDPADMEMVEAMRTEAIRRFVDENTRIEEGDETITIQIQ